MTCLILHSRRLFEITDAGTWGNGFGDHSKSGNSSPLAIAE